MGKVAVSKIKYFKKSGARLYIPQSVLDDPNWRFSDGDLVKIEVGNPSISLSKPEWWEMLDWNEMAETYKLLPEEIREKIRSRGLLKS
ncbi:TPA: hypothetical protein HA344_01250 [Candidatus Bathyarchaeota archaeon]|nr:hypothetical protein [Candidatus Bathyarchaeota archaeon]